MGLESKQHYAAIGGGITGEWISTIRSGCSVLNIV